MQRGRWPAGSGSLLLVLGHALYEELGDLLGPVARTSMVPLGDSEDLGWRVTVDPAVLGQALVEVQDVRDTGSLGWRRCSARDAEDRTSCPGIRLPGHERCLAHLAPGDRPAYLATLHPGSPLDFRGTTFTSELLGSLLDALRETGTGRARLGEARFDRARFIGVHWERADFMEPASFTRAVFDGATDFVEVTFAGEVSFDRAVFQGVRVDRCRFHRAAVFRYTVFHGWAWLTGTRFDEVSFTRADFEQGLALADVRFAGLADFARAIFREDCRLTSVRFAGAASFVRSVWESPVLAGDVTFEEVADFSRAVFEAELRVTSGTFEGETRFHRAVFENEVSFASSQFRRDATFLRAVYQRSVRFYDVSFGGAVSFERCEFHGPAAFLTSGFMSDARFDRAAFSGTAEFTDVTKVGGFSLPGGDWEVSGQDPRWTIRTTDRPGPPGS